MTDTQTSSSGDATDGIVDEWRLGATHDGQTVAVGRVAGRTKAVTYDPETGVQTVLLSNAEVAALDEVHGSRVPTPAREHIQELHQLHDEQVTAIRAGHGLEAVTDG